MFEKKFNEFIFRINCEIKYLKLVLLKNRYEVLPFGKKVMKNLVEFFFYIVEVFRQKVYVDYFLFCVVNFNRFVIKKVTKQETYRHIVEFVWTILPAVILILIAVPSIKFLYFMDYFAITDDPICTFKIIGHQWYWSYEYFALTDEVVNIDIFDCNQFEKIVELTNNDQVFLPIEFDSYMVDEEAAFSKFGGLRLLEVDNPLFIPTNTYIRFLITSVDVLHAWAVPSLGIKVDAVPGRLNQIYSIVKRPGEFYGQCSEICGINHGFMPIKVIAIEPLDYLTTVFF